MIRASSRRRQTGFTILEVIISMAISLVVLLAMVKLFTNTSRNNDVLTRAGDVVESGRTAIQLISDDLSHAGYLGGYLPTFDDLTYTDVPLDVPTAVVDPCKALGSWTRDDVINATGVTIDVRDAVPTGTGCTNAGGFASVANSDVLIVRHVDNCAVGDTGCAAFASGTPYMQVSHCLAEMQGQAVSGATAAIQLASTASGTNNAYVGSLIRLTDGTGKRQVGRISAYNGTTKLATVDSNWTTQPDNSTKYSLPMTLGTSAWPLQQRSCLSTALAERRRFVSYMYFVAKVSPSNHAVADTSANGIPTLMRSELANIGGTIGFAEPVAVIPGIEALRVVIGVDNLSKSGAAVDYTAAVNWQDPMNLVTATNRGDGAPDTFLHCTACTVAQLRDTTAAKIYVLSRSLEETKGYVNTKSYCLGEPASDGSCATADTFAAATPPDGFQRHVFMSSVRLVNIASRRETP